MVIAIHRLSTLQTPLPVIAFTTEEITGFTITSAKGAVKAPRNLPFYFFILCFTVLLTTLEPSSDFK